MNTSLILVRGKCIHTKLFGKSKELFFDFEMELAGRGIVWHTYSVRPSIISVCFMFLCFKRLVFIFWRKQNQGLITWLVDCVGSVASDKTQELRWNCAWRHSIKHRIEKWLSVWFYCECQKWHTADNLHDAGVLKETEKIAQQAVPCSTSMAYQRVTVIMIIIIKIIMTKQ